jgi:hypothetical protein
MQVKHVCPGNSRKANAAVYLLDQPLRSCNFENLCSGGHVRTLPDAMQAYARRSLELRRAASRRSQKEYCRGRGDVYENVLTASPIYTRTHAYTRAHAHSNHIDPLMFKHIHNLMTAHCTVLF